MRIRQYKRSGNRTEFAWFVLALDRADLSRATRPELRRLTTVLGEVEDALGSVVAAVDAVNRAS